MRIQTNVTAMNTHRMYTLNNNNTAKSAEKLSSGYRINRAGDDAAGLAISEKMRAQIKGLSMASKNSQDAISLVQTAEGALQEVHTMLQRMNELAVQAATGTNENFDREQIDAEFTQLKNEIDDVSKATNFNNMRLLDGTLAGNSSKAMVDSTSPIQAGKSIGNFTITNQTGLSGQFGEYEISIPDATKPTVINVKFTDSTGNSTNTEIDLTEAVTGDLKEGGAFKVDFSAAGMGMLEITAANPAADANPAGLAAQLSHATPAPATNKMITVDASTPTTTSTLTEADDKELHDPKFVPKAGGTVGSYTVSNTGGVLTLKDASGNAVGSTITLEETTGAFGSPQSISLNFGEGYDFGKITFKTVDAQAIAADQGELVDGFSFTVNESGLSDGGLTIQVGAEEGNTLRISIMKVDHQTLGLGGVGITNQDSASHAITNTRNAINLISEQRAALGAIQNRLDYKISNLDNTVENLSDAESRIRNVDMAKEMTAYTKNNILSQAATAMLAQANSMPQNVLQLLQQ